ncbi:hypothetical protein ACFX2J_035926 [Malus domestica]
MTARKKNQPQNLSSTANRAATERSFKARYTGEENQNATQSHYTAKSRCSLLHNTTWSATSSKLQSSPIRQATK